MKQEMLSLLKNAAYEVLIGVNLSKFIISAWDIIDSRVRDYLNTEIDDKFKTLLGL